MRFRVMDTQPFYILYLHQAKAIINDLQATLPGVTLLIGPIAPESGKVEPFPRREQSIIHFIITSLPTDKFEWRVGCHVLHAVDDKDVGIVRHIIEQRLLVLSCKPVFACQAGIKAVAVIPCKCRDRHQHSACHHDMSPYSAHLYLLMLTRYKFSNANLHFIARNTQKKDLQKTYNLQLPVRQ